MDIHVRTSLEASAIMKLCGARPLKTSKHILSRDMTSEIQKTKRRDAGDDIKRK